MLGLSDHNMNEHPDALTLPRAISPSLWTSCSTTCQSAAGGIGGERERIQEGPVMHVEEYTPIYL